LCFLVNYTGQIDWHAYEPPKIEGFCTEGEADLRGLTRGSVKKLAERYSRQHALGTPSGTRLFQMANEDKDKVPPKEHLPKGNEEDAIPVELEELSEEQRAEVEANMAKFRAECLAAFRKTRGGKVTLKHSLPDTKSHETAEAEAKATMQDMIDSGVSQSFVNHSPLLNSMVHNAMLE